MIDPASEHLLTLAEAAVEVQGGRGGNVSVRTIRRWASAGIRGVFLETCLRGGARFTTREAIERFFSRQNQADAQPAECGAM